ncbi:hypothetical protein M9H77_35470 [Catharanthus roseus]|uniref:Uncharacterized protein n=1 Tax=Catharanthus roseus TaxID=4058 RepID=A0ACB9ZSS8_CATRO|nr:hypothetical protein M9H77_35470 [Catharanthus roseus]
MKANIYLIINRYQRSRTADCQPYITLACDRGGAVKKTPKPVVDDEKEKVLIKRRNSYETKKCGCSFKLKGEQMATSVYNHGHAQAARITEEQLKQTEQFKKKQNVGCAVSAQKTYNVIAKIKKNRMQGRNTVEEVLYLSAKRGYTVFYRNCKESNVLSDIAIAHPISIAMIRTWPYA